MCACGATFLTFTSRCAARCLRIPRGNWRAACLSALTFSFSPGVAMQYTPVFVLGLCLYVPFFVTGDWLVALFLFFSLFYGMVSA